MCPLPALTEQEESIKHLTAQSPQFDDNLQFSPPGRHANAFTTWLTAPCIASFAFFFLTLGLSQTDVNTQTASFLSSILFGHHSCGPLADLVLDRFSMERS